MSRGAVTLHPLEPNVLHTVVDLLARALPHEAISAERLTRQVLLDPNFHADGALLARVDGSASGFILALARQTPLENAPPDSDRGYITLLGVHPACRRQGIGGRLLEAAEAFLRERGRSRVLISPYAPGYFTPGVDVRACAEGLEFLLARGYRERYRPIAMEVPLWEWGWPDWVRKRHSELLREDLSFPSYDPSHTQPLLEMAKEEFGGDWVRVVRETMGRILQGEPSSRLILARTSDGVAGFVHHDGERFGPIGVARAQRGRGIGQVLSCMALQAMRERGLRAAWFLWSDDETARRLYSGLGFREVRRFAVLEKSLEGAVTADG